MLLFQQIDKLYSLSELYYNYVNSFIKKAAVADQDLVDEITELLKSKRFDLDFKQELLVIAELYQEVMKMGKGYKTLYEYIEKFDSNYLSDLEEEEREPIDDVLNGISRSMKKAVGGKLPVDDKETIEHLLAKEKVINEEVLGNVGGLQQYKEDAKSQQDKRDQSTNFNTPKFVKEQADVLIQKMEDFLMKADESDDEIYKHICLLMANNYKKSSAVSIALGEADDEVRTAPDDLEAKEKLKFLQSEDAKLIVLRKTLRDRYYQYKNKVLVNQSAEKLKNAKSDMDRFLALQEIEYRNSLMDKDKKHPDENTLRRKLIRDLKSKSINFEQYERLVDKIKELSLQREKRVIPKELTQEKNRELNKLRNAQNLEGFRRQLEIRLANKTAEIKTRLKDCIELLQRSKFEEICAKIKITKQQGETELLTQLIAELATLMQNSKDIKHLQRWEKHNHENVVKFYKLSKQIEKIENQESNVSINEIQTSMETIIAIENEFSNAKDYKMAMVFVIKIKDALQQIMNSYLSMLDEPEETDSEEVENEQ